MENNSFHLRRSVVRSLRVNGAMVGATHSTFSNYNLRVLKMVSFEPNLSVIISIDETMMICTHCTCVGRI